ncbi:lysozyme, partial [Klebsiella pneumoniae]
MQISNNGIALIKRFEGCRLTAYPDPGTGGDPWTIGYGWTGKVDGKPIRPGMKIDDATADRLLRTGVVSFDQAVSKMLKVSVTQNQYDALVSLAYNIGTRALSTSTLMKSKRAARTVLTGMCYSVGSATRQGSSSLTRFIGQSAIT